MKNLSILLFAAIICCVTGCKTTTSPTNSGSFAGRVLLYDTTGAVLPDFSGTIVTLDGSSFRTMTDSLGKWVINGVPEGQYNITATKSGFGTFHWYEQQIVGGKLDVQTAAIATMPYCPIVLLSTQWDHGNLDFQVSSGDSGLPVGGYCDLDSNTQPSQPHFATSTGQFFSIRALQAAGAKSGQTLYISASSVFDLDNQFTNIVAITFFDPSLNEWRWASTGPKSNVIAVTMP